MKLWAQSPLNYVTQSLITNSLCQYKMQVTQGWKIQCKSTYASYWYPVMVIGPVSFSFLFSSLVCLTLYWYCKEKLCLGHLWECKAQFMLLSLMNSLKLWFQGSLVKFIGHQMHHPTLILFSHLLHNKSLNTSTKKHLFISWLLLACECFLLLIKKLF